MNLQNICYQAIEVMEAAGRYISTEAESFDKNNVESKGLHDFVSFVDKNSEKQLIDGLKKLVPKVGFIAEESTVKPTESQFKWIIDPLDGTTNFIHGLEPYAISVGLMHENEIILGVVHEISKNETFYAWQGSKAFMNGKVISVTNVDKVKDSLIATGFPYYDYQHMAQFLNSLDYFMRNSHGIRRIGSAATDLAYVACGRFEAFYEYSLSPWDVAAGSFIVQQAGGKVCDFSGGNDFIFGKEIVATNGLVHDEFLGTIKEIMGK